MSGHNIEIKAKIPVTMDRARETALRLADPNHKPVILHQSDTFFNAPLARLKLRQENGHTTLIAYERPDGVTGAKISNYIKIAIPDHDNMHDALQKALGVKGRVVKTRELYMVEWKGLTSRIHLDNVEGLGEFIEFEVLISDLSQVSNGEAMAKYLIEQFELKELLDGAYMDKIAAQS